ncbi:uncharacterized protein LOC105846275 [Hydra vulgaris]|uniref:Uncharacterized protein LOC105846275 n=1 Tax=Hydra vulgaris TaxID=6087 RepID=A0ABM4CVD8_HYDVU
MSFEEEYDIISITEVNKTSYVDNSFKDIVAPFVNGIEKIIGNPHFCKEHFRRRDLFLCEAYCLLVTGFKDATKLLQFERQLKIGAHAAVLLDLYAAGVINLYQHCENHKLGDRKLDLHIRVADENLSFTFINGIVLRHLFYHYETNGQKKQFNQSVSDWLSSAQKTTGTITSIMNNLVARGILTKTGFRIPENFINYQTLNFWPDQELEREIISTGLREIKPDSFILSLLTLSHVCDLNFVGARLDIFFKGRKKLVAKDNIRTIVETQAQELKSPKFIRKKFSFENLTSK